MPLDPKLLSTYLAMIQAKKLRDAQAAQDATKVSTPTPTSGTLNHSLAAALALSKMQQQKQGIQPPTQTSTPTYKPVEQYLPKEMGTMGVKKYVQSYMNGVPVGASKLVSTQNLFGASRFNFKEGDSGTITLKDYRTNDALTGVPIKDTNHLGTTAHIDTIKYLISGAKKRGIDPATVLAMGMQETGLTPMNPLHDNNQTGLKEGDTWKNVIDRSLDYVKEKQDYGKRLGKKDEASIIQAWNGYGKFSDKNGGDKIYGINLATLPNKTLDMNTNPVYGKRVLDIRENIIKKNPQLVQLINTVQ